METEDLVKLGVVVLTLTGLAIFGKKMVDNRCEAKAKRKEEEDTATKLYEAVDELRERINRKYHSA